MALSDSALIPTRLLTTSRGLNVVGLGLWTKPVRGYEDELWGQTFRLRRGFTSSSSVPC